MLDLMYTGCVCDFPPNRCAYHVRIEALAEATQDRPAVEREL